MLASEPLYRKEIIYSPDDHDYAAYLDGEYVGSFRTYHDAEVELDRLALELIGFVAGWASGNDNGITE
jgi:hypothetical protein